MDLHPMTMEKDAAVAAFKEYRGAFMADRNRLDGELMRGYKSIMKGNPLISLTATIKAGGSDQFGRPKLAVARADEKAGSFSRNREGRVIFAPYQPWRWGDNSRPTTAGDRRLTLPEGTLSAPSGNNTGQINMNEWQAILPIIPPHLRPKFSIKGYHLLWEAVWTRGVVRAPHDPALLKRVGGDLFAVLAVWDLTDLERAVLEMRAS